MFLVRELNGDNIAIEDTNDGSIDWFKLADLPALADDFDIVGYENGLVYPVVSNKTMISFFNQRLFDKFLKHFTSSHVVEIRYSIRGGQFVNNYVYTLRKSWGKDLYYWADHDSSKRRWEYYYDEILDILNKLPNNVSCSICEE